jgi:hypothetical protein
MTEIVILAKQGKGGFALLLKQSGATAYPKPKRIADQAKPQIRNPQSETRN